MKHAKLFIMAVLLLASVAFTISPAGAGLVRTGNFQIEVVSEEEVYWNTALNNGYNNTWYKYPQNSPPFWNEWWYNDPYIQPGGKWVQVSFDYNLINKEGQGDVAVVVNWTNSGWVGQNAPPTWDNSANPEAFIQRLFVQAFHMDPNAQGGHYDSEKIWLPIDYNPEWVSVDVQGMGNVGISGGVIQHQCVPLPGAVWLLGSGLIGLVGLRRRLRK